MEPISARRAAALSLALEVIAAAGVTASLFQVAGDIDHWLETGVVPDRSEQPDLFADLPEPGKAN